MVWGKTTRYLVPFCDEEEAMGLLLSPCPGTGRGDAFGASPLPPQAGCSQAEEPRKWGGRKVIKHRVISLPRTTASFILRESTCSSAKEDDGITRRHLSSAPYRTKQEAHLIKKAALYFMALHFFLIHESVDKFNLLSYIIRTTSGTFES